MCNLSLFKWWRHLHYRQNNSQKQFEHNFKLSLCNYNNYNNYVNICNTCIAIIIELGCVTGEH